MIPVMKKMPPGTWVLPNTIEIPDRGDWQDIMRAAGALYYEPGFRRETSIEGSSANVLSDDLLAPTAS